jgi:hypothetical protein
VITDVEFSISTQRYTFFQIFRPLPENGAKSPNANSELVVLAAKHTRTEMRELEDSINSFKGRD